MIFSEDGIREIILRMVEEEKDVADIAEEFKISEEYLKKVIRSEGFRFSNKLGIFYHQSNEIDLKQHEVMSRVCELLLKRYRGIDIDEYCGDLELLDGDFKTTPVTINLPIELHNELADEANLKEMNLSTIVQEKLLDQLEKNRPTTDKKRKEKYLEEMSRYLYQYDNNFSFQKFIKSVKNIINECDTELTYNDIFTDLAICQYEFFKFIGYSEEEINELIIESKKNNDIERPKKHYNLQIKSKVYLTYKEAESEI